MEFTKKILEIMEKRNISAYEICKTLNISQTTFSSWKKGSKPSIDKAIDILRYLQLSADELFELVPEKSELSQEETELLELFRRLPEREQLKEIGRLEEKAERFSNQQDESSSSRTG